MNMTRVDESKVRTTKGNRKTICYEHNPFALSEGFEERRSGVNMAPPVASVHEPLRKAARQ